MSDNLSAEMIVAYGYLRDIEEWIAQGWVPAFGPVHPVMARYGRAYYYREAI